MERLISSFVNSQFFPFFILSGKFGRRTRTTRPAKIAITPSIMNSQRQGARPVAFSVRFFPMAYAMSPLKAPESVAVEK
jgi:hypothetical protein